MKEIDDLIESFEANEARRASVRRADMMRKGQRNGNKSRNRTRELERAFKERNKE